MARKWMYLPAAALVVAAALIVSGCAGPRTYGSTLSGRDIFDPGTFSMARYSVVVNESGNVTNEGLIVTSYPYEKEGDRLTSVALTGDGSVRADAWLLRGRTDRVMMSAIDGPAVQVSGGSPTFNMTVFDRAWNSLDSAYTLVGRANVTNHAGQFDEAYVYAADRMMVFGSESTSFQALYFMHPSCPVPVMYMVNYPGGSAVYELESVYGPKDKDSTPERALQTMFDLLDRGDYDAAAWYWVEYDPDAGRFRPLDRQTYGEFLADISPVYGEAGEAMGVQYVLARSVAPATVAGGHDAAIVEYVSPHYDPALLNAYGMAGNFSMVKVNGGWRFIA
jgi:hypothetical protein